MIEIPVSAVVLVGMSLSVIGWYIGYRQSNAEWERTIEAEEARERRAKDREQREKDVNRMVKFEDAVLANSCQITEIHKRIDPMNARISKLEDRCDVARDDRWAIVGRIEKLEKSAKPAVRKVGKA